MTGQVTQSNEKISQILRTTYREGGIRGMYRGLTPSIVRTFPSTASLFVVYEYLDEYLTKKANESLGKV